MGECRICRAIPEVADREDPGGLPTECDELEYLGRAAFRLKRCPLCATYYSYFYDHDSGGGTSAGGTDESYRRLSDAEALEALCDAIHELPFAPTPTLETDLERLARSTESEETATLIQQLEAAIGVTDTSLEIWRSIERPGMRAAWLLGRRKTVEAMPVLVRALATSSLQAHAARALGTLGPVALPALLEHVRSDDRELRKVAACGLGHLARLAPEVAPAVREVLLARIAAIGDSSYGNEQLSRELAAFASAVGFAGYTEETFWALADLFGRTYGWEREAAIRAISAMGGVAVPPLIPLLTAQDPQVARAAIETLTELGPAARAALPALEACPLAATRFGYLVERARMAITAEPDPKTGRP